MRIAMKTVGPGVIGLSSSTSFFFPLNPGTKPADQEPAIAQLCSSCLGDRCVGSTTYQTAEDCFAGFGRPEVDAEKGYAIVMMGRG